MAEAKRKKGESFESLLRRFKRKIQQSGIILQSRKIRYHQPSKSRNRQRNDALRRMEINEEKDYLRKIGKLRDEDFRGRKY